MPRATRALGPRARAAIQDVEARYDAGGMGRRIARWLPPSSGPSRSTEEGYERLRNRARDSQGNDWAAAGSVQKWVTALIGTGIVPRWNRDELNDIWIDFVPQADADYVSDAYGLQALGVAGWMNSGEVFLRERPRSLTAPLDLPLQTQLIESDYVPMFDAMSWPGMPQSHDIRQGIERNAFGRRTAYWMYPEHPGDGAWLRAPRNGELIRVPADQVSHIFEPIRPGQMRGVSPLAVILWKLRSAGDFEDAVLERQKIANLFTMFLKRAMPPDWKDIQFDGRTGLPKFYDSLGKAVAGLEPGVSQELLPGEDVTFANPPEAGTSFADYWRMNGLGTSAGQGLPYELMTGDIREISDRTLRIVVQEFRRYAQQRQWLTVVPKLVRPTVQWLGSAAILAGRLKPSELREWMRPEYAPHAWEYIHPVQDAEADIMLRDAGITSTRRLIAKRGDDHRVILKERQEDAASGLTPPPAAPAGPAPAPDGSDDGGAQ